MKRSGCRGTAGSAPALLVLSAQAMCMCRCSCTLAATCASTGQCYLSIPKCWSIPSSGTGLYPLALFPNGDWEGRGISSSSWDALSPCGGQRDSVSLGRGWLSTRWSCTPRFDTAWVALGLPWSRASFPYPGKEGPLAFPSPPGNAQ